MENEGPILESLLQRLANCPEDFLLPPVQSFDLTQIFMQRAPSAQNLQQPGTIYVPALVADLFRAWRLPPPPLAAQDPAHLSLIAITTWLLHDDWFLAHPELAPLADRLLQEALKPLVSLVKPQSFITDPDRREELARLCLAQLSLRPKGESAAQAKDRLTTLDSAERDRVMRDTRAAETRARQIREQMAKRAAEEAAAKTTRE